MDTLCMLVFFWFPTSMISCSVGSVLPSLEMCSEECPSLVWAFDDLGHIDFVKTFYRSSVDKFVKHVHADMVRETAYGILPLIRRIGKTHW